MNKTKSCSCFASIFKVTKNDESAASRQQQQENLVKISTENLRLHNLRMGIERKVRHILSKGLWYQL